MESLSKRAVAFKLMILVQLLAASTVPAASINCEEKCGSMTISYPFGIEEGCFLDGFQIRCNTTSGKAYFEDYQIFNISLSEAVVKMYFAISYACYRSDGYNMTTNLFDTRNTPFTFSNTRNKFTSVGCQTLALIQGSFDKSRFSGGCISSCQDQDTLVDGATCSGVGCCQTEIPRGLKYIYIEFQVKNHSRVREYSPCEYAFLAEDSWYKFNISDVSRPDIYYRNNGVVPLVLDWAIGNKTCEEVKSDKKGNYLCISDNSVCRNSTNGPGYTCNCARGYAGNPYINDGCQDVDECKNETITSTCYGGNCKNTPGSYDCLCRPGMFGNASIEGSCKAPKTATSTIVLIIIAILSTFLVAAIMYLIYGKTKLNKAKEKCFRQNGGLLLQAQISAYKSVRFKIFSIKEIMKATNNFEDTNITGRGGHGIVYEGIIDCIRVAIKKSTMIDEERINEFVKEMHILSFVNHKNVIQILGCCLEVEVPILVYEFVPRGTLYQLIQEKNQRMSLGFRIQIAIDCASALTYLHHDSCPTIIHRDVKSSNILLDENNVAKVSDFGASVSPREEIDEAGVPGTYGYIDPESLSTGQLTNKSDVYSFAVVILELLTRMKAVYSDKLGVKRNLAQTFKHEGLEAILDDEIKDVMTNEQISEFSELLNICLKINGSERPTMKKVTAWLLRLQEFNPQLSDEMEYYTVEPVQVESSNQSTYSTQIYTSGNQAFFELDYNLTR